MFFCTYSIVHHTVPWVRITNLLESRFYRFCWQQRVWIYCLWKFTSFVGFLIKVRRFWRCRIERCSARVIGLRFFLIGARFAVPWFSFCLNRWFFWVNCFYLRVPFWLDWPSSWFGCAWQAHHSFSFIFIRWSFLWPRSPVPSHLSISTWVIVFSPFHSGPFP